MCSPKRVLGCLEINRTSRAKALTQINTQQKHLKKYYENMIKQRLHTIDTSLINADFRHINMQ